ncbi:aminoglycoside phosphotransferase [Microbacterium sp.]|uniref:aminoglycoside phosphotransferase n=1 Tax=Microbacterium sp. TaxID=51671 RepID=UPI003A93C9DA
MTSAVPQASVVAVSALTEHGAARFDSALAELADGRRVVVRVATDDESAAELVAEARALRALTSGVRAQLPFAAPALHGQVRLADGPALVVGHLGGYRIDAAEVPAGRGPATMLAAAIAAVHTLPGSVVRAAELPERTAAQAHAEIERLLDRVATSHRVPVSLLARWSRAVAADRLWQFEPTVTLGGTAVDAFVFEDRGDVPTITGLLSWRGLSVGDPAADLRWVSSVPEASRDVFDAYAETLTRTPDPWLAARARLYAELEFARWLVHGHDAGRDDIVDDAVDLLTSLADSVIDDDLLAVDTVDVDDAIALLGRVPGSAAASVDTSMQTDAFGPDDTSYFSDVVDGSGPGADDLRTEDAASDDPDATAPIDTGGWVGRDGDEDAVADADRASEAALRRWAASS